MGENNDGMSWEAMTLDADARLDFAEADNLCALFIGRTKVGYARGSENQAFYQSLLNQVFISRLPRTWHV